LSKFLPETFFFVEVDPTPKKFVFSLTNPRNPGGLRVVVKAEENVEAGLSHSKLGGIGVVITATQIPTGMAGSVG
jgi:hypothetical protein